MKTVKSKAQERREIEYQINHFLQHGGQVKTVASGISGRELGAYKLTPVSLEGQRETRTPLVAQIRAIEARRIRRVAPAAPKRKRPRKVLVTDDFGEPLRWRWQDA